MTVSLAVDENNDLYTGADGSLATCIALQAVLQNCEHAVKTQLGEMIYAVDAGVPNFTTVWNGSPNKTQFEAFLRRTILAVQDVTEIQELSSAASNHVMSYRAVIKTIYGLGAING